jgi:hypothetical protein
VETLDAEEPHLGNNAQNKSIWVSCSNVRAPEQQAQIAAELINVLPLIAAQ